LPQLLSLEFYVFRRFRLTPLHVLALVGPMLAGSVSAMLAGSASAGSVSIVECAAEWRSVLEPLQPAPLLAPTITVSHNAGTILMRRATSEMAVPRVGPQIARQPLSIA
jgi:hypothetical protein